MIKLKQSKYNYFYDAEDGYVLAYNSFSNSLARITKEDYAIIRQILDNPNHPATDEKTVHLRESLKKGLFLVDEVLDELEILKMRNKMGRFSQDTLGLTICPSLACNYFCFYCFEERKTDTMTPEIEAALIKFVEKRIKQFKSLQVSWFGGEPTLRIDIIERLVTAFKSLCESNNVSFQPMSIITNGYLLTSENAKRLKDLNIVSAQVTIDGPPEVHDRRRKLNDGSGTFHRILENVKASMDIINIYIRVNVDRENVDEVEKLYDIFKEQGFQDKVPFYFGHVQAHSDVCSDISTVCFSTKEHSETVVELIKKSREKGFKHFNYPTIHHSGVCLADKLNGYVIAPSGLLFKCWTEASRGVENSVGSILEDKALPVQMNNMARYINWDAFQNPECLECTFLPICSGGCPFNALKSKTGNVCTNFKYNLEEMLRIRYAEIKSDKKIKQ